MSEDWMGAEVGGVDALAEDRRGTRLVAFDPGDPAAHEGREPMPRAQTVATRGGRVVVVHDRWRDQWELPGGMVEATETYPEAAARELAEETGVEVDPERMHAVGTATFRFADGRRERGAVYRVDLGDDVQLERDPDDEIGDVDWWTPGMEPPAGASAMDLWLAATALAPLTQP